MRQTNEIWASMKNAGSGMGIKNISDLVLKETHAICKTETLKKSKLMNTKWQKGKFMKSLIIYARKN